ncbi:hypothetical protein [Solobacterium sp.]|uniref:hypothetical protein n=1 Tax=Solobacterium sp. TaxID=2060878 RepID=UPI001CAF82B4|nr:hypothetical protein [Solobacterium sp.]MBF1086099.1 hypothetical protein [Solobacterium sp.]
MLTIQLEGPMKKMAGDKFMATYEKVSNAKRELEIALIELEELGIKVDVVYLSDK